MNRRRFLKSGALIAAASSPVPFAVSSPSAITETPEDKSTHKPLRLGLIGAGQRGTGLSHLLKQVKDCSLTAVSDNLPFRLSKAREWVLPSTALDKDYRALLDRSDVDAVIIATPFSTHTQIALDALDAGKHIYCEKTMAMGVADIKKLKKAALASGKTFLVGHQARSVPVFHDTVRFVKEGKLGKVTHIESYWNRFSDWRRPVPDKKYERQVNWRMYRAYSGGLAAELCSHQIDLVNWTLAAHPETVTGFGSINYWKDGRETFDNVQILAHYPGGITAEFKSRLSNASGGRATRFFGDKGTLVIEDGQAWFYPVNKSWKPQRGIVDGVSGATMGRMQPSNGVLVSKTDKDPSSFALEEFRDCIAQKTVPNSNVETGAMVSYVVDMALTAMLDQSVQKWRAEYDS